MKNGWCLALGILVSLAGLGCRPESVNLHLEERVPVEELGLEITRVDAIDREGRTGHAVDQIYEEYQERGFLRYRSLRLKNVGKEPLVFYPIIPAATGSAFELHAHLMGGARRDEPWIFTGEVDWCQTRNLFDYRSDFTLLGAELDYANEVEEVVLGLDPETRPDFGRALLRPGETVDLTYRFGLTEDSPLVPLVAVPETVPRGQFVMQWYPSSFPGDNMGPLRMDYLVGWRSQLKLPDPGLIVMRESSEAHRVFLPSGTKSAGTIQHSTEGMSLCPDLKKVPTSVITQKGRGLPQLRI